MFTGLVQEIGTLKSTSSLLSNALQSRSTVTVMIKCSVNFVSDVSIGDSFCVHQGGA